MNFLNYTMCRIFLPSQLWCYVCDYGFSIYKLSCKRCFPQNYSISKIEETVLYKKHTVLSQTLE